MSESGSVRSLQFSASSAPFLSKHSWEVHDFANDGILSTRRSKANNPFPTRGSALTTTYETHSADKDLTGCDDLEKSLFDKECVRIGKSTKDYLSIDDEDIGALSCKSLSRRMRRSSCPAKSIGENLQYATFLAQKRYPSQEEFQKTVKANPDMDMIVIPIRNLTGESSTISLKLTQVQNNFYYANVREILDEVLINSWYEDAMETIVNVVAVIMEYFESSKPVNFNAEEVEVYTLDPNGSDNRVLLPATHLLEKRVIKSGLFKKPEYTEEEQKKAQEQIAGYDLRADFADAYL